MKISEDPYIKNFLKTGNLAKSTHKQYLKRLIDYSQYAGQTPTELIQEAITEEKQGLLMAEKSIKKKLDSYKFHLQDEGKSHYTINNYLTTVRSFYNEYEIILPRKKREKRRFQPQTVNDLPGRREIQEALKQVNLKYRSLILMQASSGMGLSEVLHLKYKDFLQSFKDTYKPRADLVFDISIIARELYQNRTLILTWHIQRYKTGMPYVTFTTPEAGHALIDYLCERHRQNKPITNLDDWIYTSDGRRRLSNDTVTKQFRKVNDHLGWGFRGRQRFFTSHKLRKFFATILNKHRTPYLVSKRLMGHYVASTDDAYFKQDIQALRNEYIRLIPHLSIEKVELRRIESHEVKEIVRELDKLKEEQKLKDEKIDKLVKVMDELLIPGRVDEKRAREMWKELTGKK